MLLVRNPISYLEKARDALPFRARNTQLTTTLRDPDILIEPKAVPLTCHGHSRPVTHLNFSPVVDHDQFYLISGCKGSSVPRLKTANIDVLQMVTLCFAMVSLVIGKASRQG